jgi:uncharacterized protein (TIGR02466 family)
MTREDVFWRLFCFFLPSKNNMSGIPRTLTAVVALLFVCVRVATPSPDHDAAPGTETECHDRQQTMMARVAVPPAQLQPSRAANSEPAVRVVLGERPGHKAASELYTSLMGQMEAVEAGDLAKLIAVSVCHAKPRSHAAWIQLANVHYSEMNAVSADSVFFHASLSEELSGYLRAQLIAALLKDETEWWEENSRGVEDDDADPAEESVRSNATPRHRATLKAYAVARASAKDYFEGEYKVLRDQLKTTLAATFASAARSQIDGMFKQTARRLGQLVPALLEWIGSRSQEFPPLVPEDLSTSLPPLWEVDKQLPGQMQALFSTHVYVVNLVDEGVIAPDLNQRIATQAIGAFEEFARSNPNIPEVNLNDAFWGVQKDPKTRPKIPEIVEILNHIEGAVLRYVTELGLGHPEPQSGFMNGEHGEQPPSEAWFSIHRGKSEHSTHNHVDAQFAVVYYPQAKYGDGRLVFKDPRGARHVSESNEDPIPVPVAPFGGNRHHIKPIAGDLIIFPGWLYHAVESSSTESDEYRVSLSVNIDGYWERSVS